MQTEAGSANWQLCVRRQLSLSLCLLVGELGNLEYWSLHMHMYKCSSHWTEKSWTVSDSSGLSLGWVRLRSSYQYQKTSHDDWFQGETQKCTMHMHMYIHVITHHWKKKSGTRKTVICASRLYQRPSVYWSMDDAVTLINIELLVFTLSYGQDFKNLNNDEHENDEVCNNNNNNKHENDEIKKLP